MTLPPQRRAHLARIAMWTAMVGWPVTQFSIARDEPPFTLALSWFAIILTFMDLAATTDVRQHTDKEQEET